MESSQFTYGAEGEGPRRAASVYHPIFAQQTRGGCSAPAAGASMLIRHREDGKQALDRRFSLKPIDLMRRRVFSDG